MKRWQILAGLGLVALSAALYWVHYLLFHDAHHIWIYLLGDVAFLPVEVLLVTLILHNLLERRAKRSRLHKLNMVVGAFFSEVGTELAERLAAFDADRADLAAELASAGEWSERRFADAARLLRDAPRALEASRGDLAGLRSFLLAKRPFLLALLENPNLLEHEGFTDMLWAVFHLTEELARRRDLAAGPDSDREHLAGDIRRAYGRVLAEWLLYLAHLKRDYPYLFSLAVRTNPFDPQARVEVA